MLVRHLSTAELEARLDEIRQSPRDGGRLDLIVRRPAVDEREVLTQGVLTTADGLVGDTWNVRSSSRTGDGSPHPDMQLNIINARLSAAVAVDPLRRPLAGDQLHVDLDLSEDNLPAGSRLRIGSAVIEITAQPHTGCAKFSARFGMEALRFVNSPAGRQLRLRGANARVVEPGVVHVGDTITRVDL